MGESELIKLIRELSEQVGAGTVRIGIGDDAAVLCAPTTGVEVLATTDQVVEGTHFLAHLHPPGALGRKTLARGLSDIAAMGGQPLWYLMSLVLPRRTEASGRFSDAWLKQYLCGLLLSTKTFGLDDLPLVGGDIAEGEQFHAHIAVIGEAPAGHALLRSGARPGDSIYVSGSLGGSALGLELLMSGDADLDHPAVRRHLEPTPRLELGRLLREAGATAAMDVSDGLSTDLARLADASGIAAHIAAETVPVFPEASIDQALNGGEDYELLFTAPAEVRIPTHFEGLRLQRIGSVTPGRGVYLRQQGVESELLPGGYEHLSNRP